jgi:S1-C subfamily serine protease
MTRLIGYGEYQMKLLQWIGVAAALLVTPLYAQQEKVHVQLAADEEITAVHRGELREAQRALEAAAREVARLSAGMAGFGVGEVMKQFGSTGRRAMLGITIEDTDGGSVVSGVSPGGPAADSGVESGALIVGVNGQSLADAQSPTRVLIEAMADVEPGDKVRLRIRQGGEEEIVEVTTRAFEPEAFVFAYEGDAPGANFDVFKFDRTRRGWPSFAPHMQHWADMELVELTSDLGAYFGTEDGLLVVRAPKHDGLDLLDGDVILEIGERRPQSTAHALRILRSFDPGEELALAIMRSKRERTISFKVPDDNKVSKR